MTDRPPTPAATLNRARRIALDNGIRHAYTGNTYDQNGQSTYCSGCGAVLIERDWFRLGAWNLDEDGRCRYCGECCPGVFEAAPGRWGARRLPVLIGR